MAKEELLEFPGTVSELLPNATLAWRRDNDHEIIAHTAGKTRKNRIRVPAGDKVLVVSTPCDLSKGRITYRFGNRRRPGLRPERGKILRPRQRQRRAATWSCCARSASGTDRVDPWDIDETLPKGETSRLLALRLAWREGADGPPSATPDAFVLAADTVVAAGARLLGKPEDPADAARMLGLLSGRAHKVAEATAVAVAAPRGRTAARLSETRLRFKRLTNAEIDAYLASEEWAGKARRLHDPGAGRGLRAGSAFRLLYTGVVGLPLYETRALLTGLGYPGA